MVAGETLRTTSPQRAVVRFGRARTPVLDYSELFPVEAFVDHDFTALLHRDDFVNALES